MPELKLPNDEIMREMVKITIEKVTEDMAVLANELAAKIRCDGLPSKSGPEVLEAFARAIRTNNVRLYGRSDKDSVS